MTSLTHLEREVLDWAIDGHNHGDSSVMTEDGQTIISTDPLTWEPADKVDILYRLQIQAQNISSMPDEPQSAAAWRAAALRVVDKINS